MPRYFVAHLLSEDIATYHTNLSQELNQRFGSRNPTLTISPHLTIKAPFVMDDVTSCYDTLRQRSQAFTTTRYHVRGFSHFGQSTLFLAIDAPASMHAYARSVQRDLHTHHSIPYSHYEDGDITFHATIARDVHPQNFSRITSFLQEYGVPTFTAPFSSISVLENKEGLWVERHRFNFQEQVEEHNQ